MINGIIEEAVFRGARGGMEIFMNMNLPNRLTMLRVLMIPFFVLFMELSVMGYTGDIMELHRTGGTGFAVLRLVSVVIFLAASFTDFLDGYIARRDGLVTDFGKFMDPLADKLLVCSALILFTAEGAIPAWIVIIIIAREFIISGFRLVAADNGIVIAASYWGKAKTVSQMILCVLLILPRVPAFFGGFIYIVVAVVVALTLISLIDYMYKNISVITSGGM